MTTSTTGIELQRFAFDAATGTYRASYEPDTTPPSMAVIDLLVRVLDCCPLEMEQLQHTVDTEALDALLIAAGNTTTTVEVSFTYENYAVTARSDEVFAESIHSSNEQIDPEVASQ